MIMSDEEYLKFIENGQKYALEILRKYFKNDDKEKNDDEEVTE